MGNSNRKRCWNRGQVLLEFAIGLPLLLTLLFFVGEAGYFLTASQAIPTALHDAAVLAVYRSSKGELHQSDVPLLEAAIVKSMKRPGIVNPLAVVTIQSVGSSSGRSRIVLEAAADYVGITPLRRMFSHKKLTGQMIVPIGDWSGQE